MQAKIQLFSELLRTFLLFSTHFLCFSDKKASTSDWSELLFHILRNPPEYSLFHSVGFVFHTVKYVSHTVVFVSHSVKQRICQEISSFIQGNLEKFLLHLRLLLLSENGCTISSKRQKMDKGIFFVTLQQIEKMHTMELQIEKMHTMELKEHFAGRIFSLISETADELGLECYVVGGYVRDIFLNRPSKDIDVVVVGSGIEMAQAFGKKLGRGAHVSVFKNFGTAQVKFKDTEVEFVGARKESYSHDSRKPIVEDGTLEDDQNRRDFTINAMAVCLNKARFGELVDPFGGLDDLKERTIRTPLDPDITFSDDPLRMMRCIRFATQLNFYIDDETFEALERNKERIKIISRERIADELNKILLSPVPSKGFIDLDRCGLLELIFPELVALQGVEVRNGRGHKDNFYHTLEVVDNISRVSNDLWLRWATLLHDIGKPRTKRWEPKAGWTFHNHNFIGEKMIPEIFRKMKLPMNEKMKYVQKLVGLHMRPIVIADEDSSVCTCVRL